MAIPFVGSKSLDDRRRRRLAVNGDGAPAESTLPDERASRVASELVISAAAAPWVPAYEWRIWTYGAMLGLLLAAVSFALVQPSAFRPELAPLTKHLLEGSRPVLATVFQTMFWFLAAQLAILIAWYRAQCKLDFHGRYRVWPWAAAFCVVAAFCSATNAHVFLGEIISRGEWLAWRSETVAWLLPACVAAIPLTVLLDRDVRRGRTTVYTLRTAWFLGLVTASLELFTSDLQEQFWYPAVRSIVPLFFGATLLLGFWLHARVVAFVCPDPPEHDEPGAASQILGAGRWCVQLAGRLIGLLFRRRNLAEAEDEAKPKRRSRKTVDSDEDTAPKRNRKAPAKRAPKPRTRTKVYEEEGEEEIEDDSYSNEVDETSDANESESSSDRDNEWDEGESDVDVPSPPVRQSRTINSNPPMPTVPPKQPATPSWQQRPAQPTRASQQQTVNQDDSDSEESESEDGDSSYRVDDGLTADPLRGLSKRQKRELRQKTKDQQRNQGR